MLHRFDTPAQAYRRVEFDARVEGADGLRLTQVCFEEVIAALKDALVADEASDPARRSRSLSRAISGLLALRLGIGPNNPLRPVLESFYGSVTKTVRDAAVRFSRESIRTARFDLLDVLRMIEGQ